MSEFKRRDFLKTSAGVAAGAAAGPLIWVKDAQRAVEQHAGEGREAARAALEALRPGRRGPVHGEHQEVHREDRHRGARRRRGLGGRAPEGGGRRQHRQRARTSSCRPTTTRNLYPEKLVDVTDVCELPRQQVRRLVPGVRAVPASPTARSGSACRWASPAVCMVYRESHVKAAGFDAFPKDTDGFLKLCKALKEKGTPAGFALGNATGDGNTWTPLAGLGARRQAGRRRTTRSSSTARRRSRRSSTSKELYETFVPGTLSWLDPNNNKAFLDGQICADDERHLGLLRRQDLDRTRRSKEMAADINHANMPIGPVGRPTEFTCSSTR